MFYAGICKMDVTPPVGYRLAGHSDREKPSEKVNDPLFLKVLTLFDGKNRVAIITSDLISFNGHVDSIKRLVKDKIDMDEKNLFLTASHTHTGPATDINSFYMPKDHVLQDYLSLLGKIICGGIIEAKNREEPVRISWGESRINIGIINRRMKTKQGIRSGPNPEGAIDEGVYVLKIEKKTGSPVAILFNYTCHPTTLSSSIYQISADYPGVAQRELEKFYPESISLFTNGCCGDVRPAIIKDGKFAGGDFEDIERMGKLLAAEVIKTAEQAEEIKGKKVAGILRKHKFQLDKTLIPVNKDKLEVAFQKHIKHNHPRYAKYIDAWKQHMLEKIEKGEKMSSFLCGSVQVLNIGEIAIVGLPGEIMVEIGLKIKKKAGKKVIVAGYANGGMGYIPTKKAMSEGGYEATSFLFEDYPAPYAPDMEETLINTVIKMLQ